MTLRESLPGLTRQSMMSFPNHDLTKLIWLQQRFMDARVKPGHDAES